MKLTTEQKITGSFSILLVFIGIMGYFAISTSLDFIQKGEWEKKAYRVQKQIDDLTFEILLIESETHNYLITHKNVDWLDFSRHIRNIRINYQLLDSMISEPTQQKLIDQLGQILIKTSAPKNFTKKNSEDISGEMKRMEEIFMKQELDNISLFISKIEDIKNYENNLLIEKADQSEKRSHKMIIYSLAYVGLSFIIIILFFQFVLIDLRKRKKIEEVMRTNEARQRAVLNILPVAMAILRTPDMRIWWANSLLVRMSGISKHELLRKKLSQLISIPGQPVDLLSVSTISDTQYEGNLIDAKGNPIPILIQSHSIELEGKNMRLISIIDISKRKSAELKLHESEHRLRSLYENANDIIVLLDNGIIVDCNPKAEEIFGVKPDQVIGKSPIDFTVNNDDNTYSKTKLEEILERAINGETRIFEWQFYNKKGDVVETEVSISRLSGNNDHILMAIVRDITRRKKAEQIQNALYTIAESTQSAIDLNDIYIIIHRAISTLMDARNFYISLTDEAQETLSFPYYVYENGGIPKPRKFGKGKTEWLIRHGQPVLADEQYLKELQEKGEIELNGQVPSEWLGSPLRIRNRIIGAVVVQNFKKESRYSIEDQQILSFVSGQIASVIEKKQADEALQQSENQLRDLIVQKDKFFSIIAHDLRSPFSGLLGFTELLNIAINSRQDDKIGFYAEKVDEISRDIYQFLEKLLEWSRAESGRMPFNPEIFDLYESVEHVIRLLENIAIQKSITLQNHIEKGTKIFADHDMLETILRNLISNALKYSFPDKKITIYAETTSKLIKVMVEDEGQGMSPEILESVFQLNKQRSTPGTNDETGSGLGLILTKELVEKQGGSISAVSEPGIGSTFSFTLPVK